MFKSVPINSFRKMAGIFLDSSSETHYTDPINIRIVYQRKHTTSPSMETFFDSRQYITSKFIIFRFELSCIDLTYDLQGSKALLQQSAYLSYIIYITLINSRLMASEADSINQITISVSSEK